MLYSLYFVAVISSWCISSVKACGPNEVDTSNETCLSACEPSCEDPCIAMCAIRNCTCDNGYYRNGPDCVPWKDCPNMSFYDPCNRTTCMDNEICVPQEFDCGNPPCPGKGTCVPKFQDCSTYPCRRCDDKCVDVMNDRSCTGPYCSTHPECVPKDVSDCNQTDCGAVSKCRMIEVTCITCPCYPIAECFPVTPGPSTPKQ